MYESLLPSTVLNVSFYVKFYNQDYRIKMCANDYSFEEWNTIHHEMGHIQYFMQYEDLPIGFRDT